MKYIEESENVTREYEVTIDDVELEKIINELDEKCMVAIKSSINVTGCNVEEATSKINSINKSKINVISERNLNDVYKDMPKYSKNQYLYECEYFCKNKSYLSYILSLILINYREKRFAVTNDTQAIKRLIDYADNEELISYEKRMEEKGITKELYEEYENNKDLDFGLLNELYQRALGCFKLKLVAETKRYDDNDANAKVYKFGTR